MIYRSIAGLLFIARMHVSPAASAVKLRKATLVYEILEFSWFFLYVSPCLFINLCNINCHCNQCGSSRFKVG